MSSVDVRIMFAFANKCKCFFRNILLPFDFIKYFQNRNIGHYSDKKRHKIL